MIKEDNYLKYDYTQHYYYLTELALTELTSVASNIWGTDTKQRLKRMGRLLHREQTKSVHNAKPVGMRHIDLIEYKIFLDEKGEREAILNALLTFAELAEMNEHDLVVLEGGKLSSSIITELRNANVYTEGEIVGYVPSEVYRVGY